MNEFTSVFDQLSKMPDDAPAADIAAIVAAPAEPAAATPAEPAVPAAPAAPAEGGAPAAPAEGEAPVDGEVPGIVEPKPGDAPADPNAAKPAAPDPKAAPAAPEAKPAAPVDKDAALLATLQAIADNSKPKAPETPAAPEQQPPELYSADQAKVIKDYLEEYPEIAGAERLIRQAEHVELAEYMFGQMAPQLAWMRDMLLTLAGNMHHNDLTTKIPTYETDREKMLAWVDEQPSFLQKGMKEVIDGGTADEVRELFQHYEKATGASLTLAAPVVIPPPKVTELPDPAKKAAEALAPVGSSRSSPALPDDPNNYSGAWRKALDEVK